MSDWQIEGFDVSVDSSGSELVRPPQVLLIVTAAVFALSMASFLFSSAIGYGVSIGASILGSAVIFIDQKRKANPNYVSLGWFSPTIRTLRYAISLLALMHVIRLAVESAR